ncbi:hypothetical protein BD410DRAFT_308991 [Rickenella mellea]|uniref:F-box domain-containing protein n=1 Tax=Rickenella mellea TaxID=50990 RepID=A0A4Y7Q245_9AGAM|nr:hypothetical protein BD410DRAFT_308991 [Rickenella mellea]
MLTQISQVLRSMKKLRNLSITLQECTDAFHNVAVPNANQQPDIHSVWIDSLHVAVTRRTALGVAKPVYDVLSYLSPSSFVLSLENLVASLAGDFLLDSGGKLFPYGSSITIIASDIMVRLFSWNHFPLLSKLAGGCNVVHTIHVEAPMASIIASRRRDSLKAHPSLRNIRLKHCDELTETDVEVLATYFRDAEDSTGLDSLEIISCRAISERVLLETEDKLGDRFTWRL